MKTSRLLYDLPDSSSQPQSIFLLFNWQGSQYAIYEQALFSCIPGDEYFIDMAMATIYVLGRPIEKKNFYVLCYENHRMH